MNSRLNMFVVILGTIGRFSNSFCETTKVPWIVNVAVICDYECSSLFQHNKSDVDRHVMSMFWDANISFKTLTKSHIFFKVHSVTQITNRKFQPVIEKVRNEDGNVVLSEILPMLFYEQWEASYPTEINVGLLLTGELGSDPFFIVEKSSLCNIDEENKLFHPTVILRIGGHSQNYCGVLARALGIMFGNSAPETETNNIACQDKSYIDTYQCGSHHHFFSKCADKQISDFLGRSNDCLDLSKTNDVGQDTKYQYAYSLAPTIADQCRLHHNSLSIFTKQEEESCQKTKCYESKYWIFTHHVGDIYPISGTLCGNSKVCFRGRCISRGFRLRNVRTETCLASTNNFNSDDKPSVVDCPTYTTPLGQFRFILNGNQGHFFIATPYSTPDANENEDKCLSIDLTGENLIFRPCNFPHKQWLEWATFKASQLDMSDKFMLYHPQTKNCLVVNYYKKLVVPSDCADEDPSHWQVFEYEIPAISKLESGYNTKSKQPIDLIQEYPFCSFLATFIFLVFVVLHNN